MPSDEGFGANGSLAPIKVLVLGGSYGGLAATVNLLDLCHGRPPRFAPSESPATSQAVIKVQITIVDERDGYYHLIGSPLALASEKFTPRAWTKFNDIPALQTSAVRAVQGSVVSVDFKRKVASIAVGEAKTQCDENYDYLIVSSGLRRVWPVVPQSLERNEYLSETKSHIQAVKSAHEGIVVIGGGAVGIEMAAELKLVHPTKKVTLIHSREKLLSSEPLPDDFKDRTLSVLREAGVEVVLRQRVTSTATVETTNGRPIFELTFSDGTNMVAGHVISAVSRSVPSSSFLPQAALDKEGFVKIGPTLTFLGDIPNAGYHFAIGDIVAWSGIKRCGAAMHMGYYAAVNIHQQMVNKRYGSVPTFMELQEIPPMIGLAVGEKAVCYSPVDGTSSGEDLMMSMFGEDLGHSICWNYMQLSQNYYL